MNQKKQNNYGITAGGKYIKNKEKLKTKWWFIWELKNGYTKIGEVLNYPPEKVRIKIKTDMIDIDFLMTENEAKGLLYGLSKVIFELGNKSN